MHPEREQMQDDSEIVGSKDQESRTSKADKSIDELCSGSRTNRHLPHHGSGSGEGRGLTDTHLRTQGAGFMGAYGNPGRIEHKMKGAGETQ